MEYREKMERLARVMLKSGIALVFVLILIHDAKIKQQNMNFINKLFGIGAKEAAVDTSISSGVGKVDTKYDGFDIEHLSHANRYFPRYKGKYFFFWSTRQVYSLETDIGGCVYASTKAEAKKIIDRYLELNGIGTTIITDF